jgi:hypothetical protein
MVLIAFVLMRSFTMRFKSLYDQPVRFGSRVGSKHMANYLRREILLRLKVQMLHLVNARVREGHDPSLAVRSLS